MMIYLDKFPQELLQEADDQDMPEDVAEEEFPQLEMEEGQRNLHKRMENLL